MISHRRFPAGLILALAAIATGCTHNVDPKVTPAKIPAVSPPINARALLLVPPSFEEYVSTTTEGVHTYKYQYGKTVTAALADLIKGSFVSGETRHVADADILAWLSGPVDTMTADLLLVPYFEKGDARTRMFDLKAELRVRLDGRSYRSGGTFSWTGEGSTTRAFTSRGGLTGSALEEALKGLSDSLLAHRSELEVGTSP